MTDTATVFTGTGHRPEKLGGYGIAARDRLQNFAIQKLTFYRPPKMILGMAQGWDQALAYACASLRIPFVAAIPCAGQEKVWPHEAQQRYHWLCAQAIERVVLAPTYSRAAMMGRNEWMVDGAKTVLALYDGSPGGTANCIAYAESKGILVVNLWADWCAYK